MFIMNRQRAGRQRQRQRRERRTGWTGRDPCGDRRWMRFLLPFGVGRFGVGWAGVVPVREADQTTGFIMRKNQSMRILVGHIV